MLEFCEDIELFVLGTCVWFAGPVRMLHTGNLQLNRKQVYEFPYLNFCITVFEKTVDHKSHKLILFWLIFVIKQNTQYTIHHVGAKEDIAMKSVVHEYLFVCSLPFLDIYLPDILQIFTPLNM